MESLKNHSTLENWEKFHDNMQWLLSADKALQWLKRFHIDDVHELTQWQILRIKHITDKIIEKAEKMGKLDYSLSK